jgi:hypothetical protein
MSTKLTNQQIEKLYEFCKKHKVKYYDVQIELVDHIAEAIEKTWKENENISFEENLEAQYEKFGEGGFKKLENEKARLLNRKYFRLQWDLIAECYTVPKIFISLAITAILFTTFRFFDNDAMVIYPLFIMHLMAFGLISMNNFFKKQSILSLVPGFKSLMSNSLNKFGKRMMFLGMVIPNFAFFLNINLLHVTDFTHNNNIYIELAISLFLSFYFSLIFIASKNVMKRIKGDFIKEFPQFEKIINHFPWARN